MDEELQQADKTLRALDRVLAGVIGAVVFGVLTPLLYPLLVGWPDSLTAFVWLAAAGAGAGACLGVCFSRFFLFLVEFVGEVVSGS